MVLIPGMYIPQDLIRCIADHCCRSEVQTLASLNSYFYHTLIPNLYADVQLGSRKEIELFCETLINGRTHLAEHSRVISIAPTRVIVRMIHTFAHLIREALHRTINLVDLEISLPSKAVKTIFRDARYHFALRRLACPLVSSTKFSRFLAGQPTIRELVVLRNVRGSVTVGTSIRNIDPDSLPNLSSVSANFETLLTLVPRRPMSNVDTGSSVLSQNQFGTFAETLSRALNPVEAIGVTLHCDPITCMRQIQLFTDSLQRRCVSPKHLSIRLIPQALVEFGNRSNYDQVSSLAAQPHLVHGLIEKIADLYSRLDWIIWTPARPLLQTRIVKDLPQAINQNSYVSPEPIERRVFWYSGAEGCLSNVEILSDIWSGVQLYYAMKADFCI